VSNPEALIPQLRRGLSMQIDELYSRLGYMVPSHMESSARLIAHTLREIDRLELLYRDEKALLKLAEDVLKVP